MRATQCDELIIIYNLVYFENRDEITNIYRIQLLLVGVCAPQYNSFQGRWEGEPGRNLLVPLGKCWGGQQTFQRIRSSMLAIVGIKPATKWCT